MTVLSILVQVLCGLTAVLAVYYTVRDLSADLVLLGGCAAVLLIWLVQAVALGLRDLGGTAMTDPVTLYGYLFTGLVLPLGGAWAGVWERSRWGSLAIGAVALTLMEIGRAACRESVGVARGGVRSGKDTAVDPLA